MGVSTWRWRCGESSRVESSRSLSKAWLASSEWLIAVLIPEVVRLTCAQERERKRETQRQTHFVTCVCVCVCVVLFSINIAIYRAPSSSFSCCCCCCCFGCGLQFRFVGRWRYFFGWMWRYSLQPTPPFIQQNEGKKKEKFMHSLLPGEWTVAANCARYWATLLQCNMQSNLVTALF